LITRLGLLVADTSLTSGANRGSGSGCVMRSEKHHVQERLVVVVVLATPHQGPTVAASVSTPQSRRARLLSQTMRASRRSRTRRPSARDLAASSHELAQELTGEEFVVRVAGGTMTSTGSNDE
jgi:hypothetical protein